MKTNPFILSFAVLAVTGGASASSLIDPEDGMLDMSEYLIDKPYGFLPVPVLITEPALGYGGGLFGLFLNDPDKSKKGQSEGLSPPPSITAFGGGGTSNGTWFTGVGHRHSWFNDRIRYIGAGGYANINLDIYGDSLPGGLGNKGMSTQTRGYGGMQKLLFRLGESPFLLGPTQFWVRTKVSADNAILNAAYQRLLGEESTSSGAGLVAEYDTRDNIFYPQSGTTASVEYLTYSGFLGGDYDYQTLTVDGKFFQPLSKTVTLALATNYQSLNSHEQFLTPMARPYIQLRGISRYRYQGEYVSTLQSQLEWNVSPRWTVQGFIGAGSAENIFSDLYQQVDVAWGSGFRYFIAQKLGLRTGIDIAFSDHEQTLYFNIGSGL